MTTIYATIHDLDMVGGILADLLEAGVSPEDLSAILPESYADRLEEVMPVMRRPSIEHDLDAGTDVREEDFAALGDPIMESARDFVGGGRAVIYESVVGGGISTATPDDDVSAIEEMDDSQSIAEEMLYPEGGRDTRSNESLRRIDPDVDLRVRDDSGVAGAEGGIGVAPMVVLMPTVIPGLGVVLGEGLLATSLMDAELDSTVPDLKLELCHNGVRDDVAVRICSNIDRGGALLCVTAPSGDVSLEAIHGVIDPYVSAKVASITLV